MELRVNESASKHSFSQYNQHQKHPKVRHVCQVHRGLLGLNMTTSCKISCSQRKVDKQTHCTVLLAHISPEKPGWQFFQPTIFPSNHFATIRQRIAVCNLHSLTLAQLQGRVYSLPCFETFLLDGLSLEGPGFREPSKQKQTLRYLQCPQEQPPLNPTS